MRKAISVTVILLLSLVLLFALIRCSGDDSSAGNEMYHHICEEIGISLPKDVAIKYEDSHGGFHGDGVLLAVVTATNEEDKSELKTILTHVGWRSELPEEMYAAFFGGVETIEGVEYPTAGYVHDLELDIPNVKNACFYYKDRYFEQYGEQCTFAPYTQNFTLAVFDLDTNILYFIEGDM